MKVTTIPTKETLWAKLEEFMKFGSSTIGPNIRHEEEVEKFFKENLDFVSKTGKFGVDENGLAYDELLKFFKSYLFGEKRLEMKEKYKKTNESDGYFKLYENITLFFRHFLRYFPHTAVADNYTYHEICNFIEETRIGLLEYTGVGNFITSGTVHMGWEEKKTIVGLLAIMIEEMELSNHRKLFLMSWMCEMMPLSGGDSKLRYRYDEFLVGIYTSVVPKVFTEEMKKKMVEDDYLYKYQKNKNPRS